VYRGNCPLDRVGHQNRQTIGGANPEHDSRLIRNERVSLSEDARSIREQNFIRVCLPDGGERSLGRPMGARSRTETMFQPRDIFQGLRPIHSLAVDAEQIQF
jgi:hypothetical protein